MRKIIAVFAVLAALVASLSMTATAARAGTRVDTPFSDVELCNLASSSLCMNGFDGDGAAVKGYPFTPGDAQDVNVYLQLNCGGTVTHSCPFTLGSGMNDEYFGDTIIGILNDANSMVYRSNSSGDGVIESQAGNGQVWVQSGDLAGAHPMAVLVNVYASDRAGVPIVACTDGTGVPLQLAQYESSNCNWQAVAGS
jgi:hypothetical protein